jgi:hypothetical protein
MSRSELVCLGLTVGLAACAPTGSQPDAGEECIAFPSDFAGYESWTSYSFPAEADAAPPDPDAGCTSPHNFAVPRVVYVNAVPPDGSTAFPACTKMVKEARVTNDPSTWQVYGMNKQDESSFALGSGCVGWDWYELSVATNGTTPSNPGFVWQGANPPANSYQGCQSCASCHTNAQNDCVWMIPLSGF